MTNQKDEVDKILENYADKIKDIEEFAEKIPFGMSQYQIQKFIAEAKMDLSGAAQACALNIWNTELQGLYYTRKMRKDIKTRLREIDASIAKGINLASRYKEELTEFDIERLLSEREYEEKNLMRQEKLLRDTTERIDHWIEVKEVIPEFTREEWQKAQPEAWKKRHIEEAKCQVLERQTGIKYDYIQHLRLAGINPVPGPNGSVYFERVKNGAKLGVECIKDMKSIEQIKHEKEQEFLQLKKEG